MSHAEFARNPSNATALMTTKILVDMVEIGAELEKMLITRDRYPSDISTWFSCLRRLSSIRRPNRKTEEGFCRFAEPHASIVTRAERLPVTAAVITGNGNESGVDWRSTEETDQETLVVDAVDNRRTDPIRIIY
jgi:hypothetical protein